MTAPGAPPAVWFETHDGVTLRGRLFPPAFPGPAGGIVMTHGFSATRAMGLDAHARHLASAGFAVLAYDHRDLGESGGARRGLVDPLVQARDAMAAIGWLAARPEVDPVRIGLWGTSYSGAQALVLAALDPRVRAAVALVPSVGRPERVDPGSDAAWRALAARVRGARSDPDAAIGPRAVTALMPDPPTAAWLREEGARPDSLWRDEVWTPARAPDEPPFDPAPALPHLRAPVLLIAGEDDRVAPAADARAAAALAGPMADLLVLPGHHCSFYGGREGFDDAAAAAAAFLARRC